MDKQDFVTLCLARSATAEEIDDYIERWHMGLAGQGMQLPDFLGMSPEEYALWVRDPDQLPSIIRSHAARDRAA